MAAITAMTHTDHTAMRPEPRLIQAAHEFEAQLVNELLKPMTHALGTDEDSDSGSGGALADFATEALGKALSQNGGLGIADTIIRNLSVNNSSLRIVSRPAAPQPTGPGGGQE